MSTRPNAKLNRPLTVLVAILGALCFASGIHAQTTPAAGSEAKSNRKSMPGYLKGYESEWEKDPRAAALKWFKEAKFGMFIHWSPATGLSRDWGPKINPTWKKNHDKNSVLSPEEYDIYLMDKFEPKLMDPQTKERIDTFAGEKFDADAIADLAVAAGMKYINFTTHHVNGRVFMFDTKTSPLNTMKLAPKRDFVAELSKACQKRNLGLFFYVQAPYTEPVILDRYRTMLTELLTNYGPVAGIWFDGAAGAYKRQKSFDVDTVKETYALIRKLQPQTLISFKTGYTGTEDFIAPEWHQCSYDENGLPVFSRGFSRHAPPNIKALWDKKLRHLPVEGCNTILKGFHWFYYPSAGHKSVDEILHDYRKARKLNINYVLNVGPLFDGSIHAEDAKILRGIGERLSKDDWMETIKSKPKKKRK